MEKEFYYSYCKGILGVKANVDDFRWIYGSVAPKVSEDEYRKCVVQFEIYVKSEEKLWPISNCSRKFQSYTWDSESKTISCRRTILKKFKIGYDITVKGNRVYAEIGRNYYKFVRNRVMNLHGIFYLLGDLANILLLKNGFLSLYASAVYHEEKSRGIVHFAPPNTGKTLTATKLCEHFGYDLVGEDVALTDGERVYACPWTSSYRTGSGSIDDGGSLGRTDKGIVRSKREECRLTDLVVLSLGEHKISQDPEEIKKQICILNGYLFAYYSSPIIKLLAYFDEEYRISWNILAYYMLKRMVENCNCRLIQAETPMAFYELVDQ